MRRSPGASKDAEVRTPRDGKPWGSFPVAVGAKAVGVIRPEARLVAGQRPAHQRLGLLQAVGVLKQLGPVVRWRPRKALPRRAGSREPREPNLRTRLRTAPERPRGPPVRLRAVSARLSCLPTRFGRISGSGHAGPPFAACGLIGTASAVASIGTRLPIHRVVAALPDQPIPACSSLQDMFPAPPNSLSLPLLPYSLSRPGPPQMMSSPPRPKIVSVSGQATDDIIAPRCRQDNRCHRSRRWSPAVRYIGPEAGPEVPPLWGEVKWTR
jgi:hypothetical protein